MTSTWSAMPSISSELAAGDEHRAAIVGEPAQQALQPAHALGIQALVGLVEDQHLGVAEQRRGERQPPRACRRAARARGAR